jgi:hypothetical protein
MDGLQENHMHFDERDDGDFRIYAGAMETPSGYIAAVAVRRLHGGDPTRVLYRDEAMAGGHVWGQPKDALQYAVLSGQKWIRGHFEPRRPSALSD